jgi:hypothetical protein
VGRDHAHRLPRRSFLGHRLRDRHAAGRAVRTQRRGPPRPLGDRRHPSDHSRLRLSDSGRDVVPRRRRGGDARHRPLRHHAGHPLHRPWHPPGLAGADRGGEGLRLHAPPAALARADPAGAAGDHARHQPGGVPGALHGHHRGDDRHQRSRPGGVQGPRQGRRRPRPHRRPGGGLHRHHRRPADQRLERPRQGAARPRLP